MKTVIAGAGVYGQVYLDYLVAESDLTIVGFLDDDPMKAGKSCRGLPIVGGTEDYPRLRELGVRAVLAPIGNNRARLRILEGARAQGFSTPNFIHPSVVGSTETSVGTGVYILPGSILMPYVTIGDFVMISIGVRVGHHGTLESGSFLSTGVNLGAGVTVRKCGFLGIGSTVMTGVRTVGSDSIVGAGAVVIRDVPDSSTVVGNPAKAIDGKSRH